MSTAPIYSPWADPSIAPGAYAGVSVFDPSFGPLPGSVPVNSAGVPVISIPLSPAPGKPPVMTPYVPPPANQPITIYNPPAILTQGPGGSIVVTPQPGTAPAAAPFGLGPDYSFLNQQSFIPIPGITNLYLLLGLAALALLFARRR
jgi:hypothetical protein